MDRTILRQREVYPVEQSEEIYVSLWLNTDCKLKSPDMKAEEYLLQIFSRGRWHHFFYLPLILPSYYILYFLLYILLLILYFYFIYFTPSYFSSYYTFFYFFFC